MSALDSRDRPWKVRDLHAMATVDVLEREMFSEAEAARLLGVPQSTLHYWLEGKDQRGHHYRPVIRVEPKGAAVPVTWAEFVEAGLLREYRRTQKVPLGELRLFIDKLRDTFDVPYPLADQRPYASGKALMWNAQTAAGLSADFALVAVVGDQYLLTPPSESFLRRVRWEGDVAAGWRPASDPKSPVIMDPNLRFGQPAIKGVSTEVIWEHRDDGEDEGEVADAFGLTVRDVRWALAYENSRRAA